MSPGAAAAAPPARTPPHPRAGPHDRGGRQARRGGRERPEWAHAPRSPRGLRSGCGDGAPGARRPVRRAARVRGSGSGTPSHGPTGPSGRSGGRAVRRGDGLAGRCGRGAQGPGRAVAPAASLSTARTPLASSGLFCTVRRLRSLRHSLGSGRAGSCAGRGLGAGRRRFKMEIRAGAGRGPTCRDRGPRAQPGRRVPGARRRRRRRARGSADRPKRRGGSPTHGPEPP